MTSHTDDAFSLAGRTALITASASGMGRAGALLFAARGAHVIVVDLDAEGGQDTVAEITRAGGSGEAHAVDLSDQDAVEALLEDVTARHDVIDALYNHAGVTSPLRLEYDADSFTHTMKVNVWAPMLLTQRLLPQLRRSRSASIIFTASTSGLVASPYRPLYAASKGAVIQFMKSIAVLLGPEAIRANAICPGPIATPALGRSFAREGMRESLDRFLENIPLGRRGTPEEVAHTALFLASDASRFLTGAAIPVDGGYVAG